MDVTKGCRYYSFYSKQTKILRMQIYFFAAFFAGLDAFFAAGFGDFFAAGFFAAAFGFAAFFGNFLRSLFSCGLCSLLFFFCCRFLGLWRLFGYCLLSLVREFVA